MQGRIFFSQLPRRDLLAVAGLLVICLLVMRRYLFVWPTPLMFPDSALGTDLVRETWPFAHLIRETMREEGYLPLWRSYLLSGAPLAGHPVIPLLYLPYWLILALPLALALNVIATLHLWWAGAGTYSYLRLQHGLHAPAALLGALIFAFSPKWIAHLSGGHWLILAAVAWWPWTWLAFTRGWSTRHRRWAVLLGVALAAQTLNHGNYLALSLLALGVGTLGLVVQDWRSRLGWAVQSWGIALVLLIGLAAGHLWPLLELLPLTDRTSLSAAEASFGSLPPLLLLGSLVPTRLEFTEWFVFLGGVALLLALYGASTGWTPQEKRWGIALAAGIVLALGMNTPLYRALYEWVPGFNLFRVAARWWLFVVFAVAVLAAYGTEKWLAGRPRAPRFTRGLVILGAIYLAGAALNIVLDGALPFKFSPFIVPLAVAGTLLLLPPRRHSFAALTAVLLLEIVLVNTMLLRPASTAELLSQDADLAAFLEDSSARGERSFAPYAALPQTDVVVHGLLTADGYDSFQLSRYAALVRRAIGCDYAEYVVAVPPTQASKDARARCPDLHLNRALLALLNVRYVLLDADQGLPGAALVWEQGERRVYDLGAGHGRAFGVASAVTADDAQCLDRLADLDPAVQAVVNRALPADPGALPPRVIARQTIRNGERFTVSAPGAGLLVRSESWAPGWQVKVDGRPASLLRADCALQGVWVPAGDHRVVFEYRPAGYLAGRWISLGTALLLVMGCILVAAHRREG